MNAARRLVPPAWPGRPDLVLEPPTPADAEAITEHCQDPEIQEWTTVPAPYSREDARAFLESVERDWADASNLTWALREDGRLIGMIGLGRREARSAEIGYWLAPAVRGRGLMGRAVNAVVDHAFDPDGLGLEHLFWQAFVGNQPSRRVAERAGFTIEGAIRGFGVQRGARRDAWVGTLLSTDPRPSVRARMSP